jgi:hypothetical protein
VNALALVLNVKCWKLGCLEWWWLGGIYSPQPPHSRWGRLLSMGAPDSPVRQPHHTTVRVRALSTVGGFCLIVAPDSPVPHRTGTVHCPVCLCQAALLCRALLRIVPLNLQLLQSTVVQWSRCSAGAPDSPVAHRIVW